MGANPGTDNGLKLDVDASVSGKYQKNDRVFDETNLDSREASLEYSSWKHGCTSYLNITPESPVTCDVIWYFRTGRLHVIICAS